MAADAFATPTRRRLSDLPNSPALHKAWDLSGPGSPFADVAVDSILPETVVSGRKARRSSNVLRQEMLADGAFLLRADSPSEFGDPFHGADSSEIADGSFVEMSTEV